MSITFPVRMGANVAAVRSEILKQLKRSTAVNGTLHVQVRLRFCRPWFALDITSYQVSNGMCTVVFLGCTHVRTCTVCKLTPIPLPTSYPGCA